MIDYLDAEEVARHILGIDEDAEDLDDLTSQGLYEQYGMDIDQFRKLLTVIVPMIEIAESPLTHRLYKGFVSKGRWIVKIPVEKK
jgi:hypothetical protein